MDPRVEGDHLCECGGPAYDASVQHLTSVYM